MTRPYRIKACARAVDKAHVTDSSRTAYGVSMSGKAAATGKKSAPEQLTVTLPVDCRLAGLDDLVGPLQEAAGRARSTLDGSAVERIDTAGLQLLLAYRRAAAAQGHDTQWAGASDSLNEAADLLGLSSDLALPAVTPA